MAVRGAFGGLVAVLLATVVAAPAAARPLGAEPATYGVSRPQELTIRMSDGVVLKGDVYWPTDARTGDPAPGPFPVVLAQTPYAKRSPVTTDSYGSGFGGDGYFPYLVQRGYVNAIVDVRGTGSSGGDFQLFGPREVQDGVELVDWAARLPRSDGRVGTAGSSYLGLNQVFTAAAVGPRSPLKAIFPVTTGNDLYRDLAFGGGIPNVEFDAVWLALRSTMVAAQPSAAAGRALRLGQLDAQLYANSELGEAQAFDEDFWQQRSPRRVLERVVRNGIPAFFWSGWFDVYQRGAPLSYAELQNAWAGRDPTAPMAPGQPTTGRYQLTMGPWFHNPTGLGLPIQQAQLAWFDRWLKGARNGIDDTTRPLHAYELGAGRWIDARDYPLGETGAERLYLGGGRTGTAPASANDGTLTTRRPPSGGSDRIAWDDGRSPCNRGLDQWNTGFGTYVTAMAGLPALPCSNDDSSTQDGALTYTSAPVPAPATLAGPTDATLFLTSTARDAEVVVSLEDVAPSGRSYPLTSGALIGSLRALDTRASWSEGGRLVLPYHPYTRASAQDLAAGRVERLDVEVYPTFARLAPGHRLRVTITTGDSALQPSALQAGRLAGGVYAIQRGSFVDVPIAPASRFRTSPVDWGGCNGSC